MDDYALVDGDGMIVNIIAWDGTVYNESTNPRGWALPVGISVIPDPDRQAVIGGTYKDGSFHPPGE